MSIVLFVLNYIVISVDVNALYVVSLTFWTRKSFCSHVRRLNNIAAFVFFTNFRFSSSISVAVLLYKTMNIVFINLLRMLIRIRYEVNNAIEKEKPSRLHYKLVKTTHAEVLCFFWINKQENCRYFKLNWMKNRKEMNESFHFYSTFL